MHAIRVERVNQVFHSGFWMKRVQILFDVSFDVPQGKIFGLLGANGAGKTTLIHSIVGLRRPTSGVIQLKDQSPLNRNARRHIGYLPERPYFYEHLTGKELLRLSGVLSGMTQKRIIERTSDVLAQVGLGQIAANRELRKFSKGMLQRIGIAQAILHDPEILIFDEPMSGLDPLGRREMLELFRKLNLAGKTIFFSSHAMADVEAVCDSIAVLQAGRLNAQGRVADLLLGGSEAEVYERLFRQER